MESTKSHPELEKINLDELDHASGAPPIKRGPGSLLIAIIFAAMFLLASVGVVLWWLWQRQQAPMDTTVTKSVKAIKWVAPDNLPAAYVKRVQNTSSVATTYYFDDTSDCGLTTTVSMVAANSGAVKDIVKKLVTDASARGVSLSSSGNGQDYTLHSSDGSESFDFASLELIQAVNVPRIKFKEQDTIIAYRQFGAQLGTVAASCKASTWDAKNNGLMELMTNFQVEVTR